MPSDQLIFLNGHVLTMDSEDTVAEAVAVKDDEIEAVGKNEEIQKLSTENSRIVDLKGKTMLPGFIEAHGHFPFSGFNAVGVNVNSPPIGTMSSLAGVMDALRNQAQKTEKGKWIIGFGFDDTLIREKRHLTCTDLDDVSTDNPVFVAHISGHLAYANNRGLALVGITENSPNPEGGVICKDPESGKPNGILEETAAMQLLNAGYGSVMEKFGDIVEWAVKDYASNGVTTVQCGLVSEILMAIFQPAFASEVIPLRVGIWPDHEFSEKIVKEELDVTSYNSKMVQMGAAKIIGDGSIQGYTAHLTKPYFVPFKGDKEYRGYPVMGREKMTELVKIFHRAGMQIAIHGNGDATIDDIIYAVDQAQKEYPREDTRHIVIHAQTARDDQLDEMKRLGLTPSFFSAHAYYWGDRHCNIFLGEERAFRMNPAKSALDKGVRFTIHLDTPVTPINPLLLVWSAVNRISSGGNVIGEDECITPTQALRAVTIDAAWQIFQEKNRGSLEIGKYADMVILSDNPLKNPSSINNIDVVETIVGGATVYRKET
ncbi:MAG: amidohydrolase [Deltaproteobacteria bacterium]|nr:amidohydrolase [Deltaproteobacteria bacterium]